MNFLNVIKGLFTNPNFVAALVAIAGAVGSAIGLPQASIQQITGLISAAAVLIATIFGYNISKAAQIKAQSQIEAAKVANGK